MAVSFSRAFRTIWICVAADRILFSTFGIDCPIAAIYDVPLFRDASQPLVRTLLGGWQLGTIITAANRICGRARRGCGHHGDRRCFTPECRAGSGSDAATAANGRGRGGSTRRPLRFLNRAALERRPRHPIHLPGLNQVDASATKNFRFVETHQLQFRAEFFNAFNHVNLGAPGLNIRDPDNFGRVTSTSQGAGMPGDSRVVQFALKYNF